MLEKLVILHICLKLVAAQLRSAQLLQTNKPLVLKLTPEQIRDTFSNVLSDDYIKILAKDFATKAAENFVKEIKNQKKALEAKYNKLLRTPDQYSKNNNQPAKPTKKPKEDILEVLESREAFNLLREPSPDGDHLDSQSEELSGESKRDKIPVIQVTKINGIYYRRLLGLI